MVFNVFTKVRKQYGFVSAIQGIVIPKAKNVILSVIWNISYRKVLCYLLLVFNQAIFYQLLPYLGILSSFLFYFKLWTEATVPFSYIIQHLVQNFHRAIKDFYLILRNHSSTKWILISSIICIKYYLLNIKAPVLLNTYLNKRFCEFSNT